MSGKIKCLECGRQMQPYHQGSGAEKVLYGKNQTHRAYICKMGHTRYVKVREVE